MNARRLAQLALLAIVAVTLVIVLRPEKEESAVAASAVQDQSLTEATYVAYYFHGDIRCETCRSIEAQAENAVRDGFPEEVAEGVLAWRVVNIDQSENAHFTEEFGLTHSTVVLVERDGGQTLRFTALDRVWDLILDDEEQFRDYVQSEVADWMQSGS